MKEIKLSQEKVAIVDDDIYEYLNQWKWHYTDKGYAARHPYKNGKQTTILMHRIIMNTPNNMDTDHINHNGLDNRRCNLRVCTTSQNMANNLGYRNNTSGRRGVYWDKEYCKWRAIIGFKGKFIHLGRFTDIEDAAEAYNKKAKELYGEFAYKS